MSTKAKSSANGTVNRIEGTQPAERIETVTVPKPLIHKLKLKLVGIEPLLICRMSQKAIEEIKKSGKKGTDKGKAVEEKKQDPPEVQMNNGRHISTEGWDGIHCASFRGAMIEAARSVHGLTMAALKSAIFIKADGFSTEMGEPLVRIYGKPEMFHNICRSKDGKPLPRYRPQYKPWRVILTLTVNASILSVESAVNLVAHAGLFCGVGEWRPTSPESKTGQKGTFELDTE